MRCTSLGLAFLLACAASGLGCGTKGYDSASKITTLRVLAVQKEPAYGTPNGTVDLKMLVWDGKASPGAPRRIMYGWLPCYNPLGDLYYNCFAQFATAGFGFGGTPGQQNEADAASAGQPSEVAEAGLGGGDLGDGDGGLGNTDGRLGDGDEGLGDTDGGLGDTDADAAGPAPEQDAVTDAGAIDSGIDAGGSQPAWGGFFVPTTPPGAELPADSVLNYSIRLPARDEIITRTAAGTNPYGLVYIFFTVCAGQLEFAPSQSPLPLACYGADHELLGADDFVVGYSSVYVYEQIENHNPVITGMLFDKEMVQAGVPIHVPRCVSSNEDNCPTRSLQALIDRSSGELDPSGKGPNGEALGEQVWVSYSATRGGFTNASRLVNDAMKGWNAENDTEWRIPVEAGPARIWAFVRDNRGGVAWTEVDIVVDP